MFQTADRLNGGSSASYWNSLKCPRYIMDTFVWPRENRCR